MLDMVSPRSEGKITLGDLKACKMTNIFFDTFFNLDKFLEHEQRDPFANARVSVFSVFFKLNLLKLSGDFHFRINVTVGQNVSL